MRFMPARAPLTATAIALAIGTVSGAAAQTVTINNKLANGYPASPLPDNCAAASGSGTGLQVDGIPSGYHLERAHRIYNDTTRKWVLWAHYDSSNYTTAEALVATSSTECGPYTVVKHFRPLGYQVRDDFVFKDTYGTGYFIAASNKNGGANDSLALFRLTSDYLDVDSTAGVHWVYEGAYREAPIILKKGAVYFLLTSQAAGWFPSQAAYVTTTNLLGTWSASTNLGAPNTFGGQNADAKTIKGSSSTAYILTMDHLGGNTARDDGWIQLPVLLDEATRTATLDWYSTWSVNTSTGVLTLPSTDNIAATRPATASSTASGSSPQLANDRDYYTKWVAGSGFPATWTVDLQSVRHVGEIQITWPMVKGSEAYYKYRIQLSSDGSNWTTYDHTNNSLYGFTVDKFDTSARYVRVNLVDAVLQNNPNNWYTPGLFKVRVL